MKAKSPPKSSWRAVTLAVIIMVVAGWFWLAGLFAGGLKDNPARVAFILGVYIVGSGLVGALLPHRWYLSIFCAWGIAPPTLIAAIIGLVSDHQGMTAADLLDAVAMLITGVVIVPLGGVFFGYLGAAVKADPDIVQLLCVFILAAGLLFVWGHGIP